MGKILNGENEANPFQSLSQRFVPPAFALLIDADNTAVETFPEIVKKAEIWGTLTLRRAYGNQETLLGQKWKDLCLQYALQPMLHLEISGVKNATDIALVVDAIDLFHTQAIRQFCLVTGDQGFTSLILRLRSYGCQVYCIGKPSKGAALAKVSTEFFPMSDLLEPLAAIPETQAKATTPARKTQVKATTPAKKTETTAATSAKKKAVQPIKAEIAKKSPHDPDLTHLLIQAMTDLRQEIKLEWIPVARLGGRLKQLNAQFEAKAYGQKTLPTLCKARTDLFECRPKGAHLEVRLKSL